MVVLVAAGVSAGVVLSGVERAVEAGCLVAEPRAEVGGGAGRCGVGLGHDQEPSLQDRGLGAPSSLRGHSPRCTMAPIYQHVRSLHWPLTVSLPAPSLRS